MIIAYTDGSCNYKSKLGGYGIYITKEENEKIVDEIFFNKGLSNTTTGRAELHGAIKCLKLIKEKDQETEIYCDSEYVVKCISERRLWKWKRNLWIGVKNPDLLMQFYDEIVKFKRLPKFIHIKGHTGFDDKHSLGNQIVDHLADYKQFTEYELDKIE